MYQKIGTASKVAVGGLRIDARITGTLEVEMVICKHCKKELPDVELFAHSLVKHRSEFNQMVRELRRIDGILDSLQRVTGPIGEGSALPKVPITARPKSGQRRFFH